jgi:two-component system, chemotaxis family, response regulator Rcp1
MHVNRNKRNKPIEILLIEDNQGDNRLTKEVFKEAAVPNHIQIVTNGVKAMHYLNKEKEYKNAPHPDLILLDLNIPKKDGREILKEIKENPDLKCIPIIVLTTSQSEMDIKSTYEHYANAYITKPLDLNEFIEVIRSIEEYWLSTVELPPGCGG